MKYLADRADWIREEINNLQPDERMRAMSFNGWLMTLTKEGETFVWTCVCMEGRRPSSSGVSTAVSVTETAGIDFGGRFISDFLWLVFE